MALIDKLTAIGNAIREKTETTSLMTLDDMPNKIRNIEGSGSGGETKPNIDKKDVNFYDYDGTLLYSYTIAEANALTELPSAPTNHEELEFQEWNYSLDDIVATTTKMDVGATYITKDRKTHFYINIGERKDINITLTQTVANGSEIDWDDGNVEILKSTSISATHTYAESGKYVIKINVLDGQMAIPKQGTSLPASNFQKKLQKVFFGNDCLIGTNAFQSCYSLSSITIPNSVTTIGVYAFQSCYSLSSIVIPNLVTTIEANTFQSCFALNSIAIPNSVTTIGIYAFCNCYVLDSIAIPNSVTTIGTYAFAYCYVWDSIIIPNSVTTIGASAFYSCTLIKAIYIYSDTPPELTTTSAFSNTPSDCIIYVPAESVDTYKKASYWSSYARKIQAMPE